jgi:hypothetical protein
MSHDDEISQLRRKAFSYQEYTRRQIPAQVSLDDPLQ